MAHGITIREDGSAEAAFSRTLPWHDLGKKFLDRDMLSSEALIAAQLDWTVDQVKVFRLDESGTNYEELPKWKLNVRSDNGYELGMVSDKYKTIDQITGFKFMDGLVMDGLMKYESAFSLHGGKIVVLVAKLPSKEADQVSPYGNDNLDRYLAFSLRHDGLGTSDIFPTSVRIVCANTLQVGISAASGKMLKIRHTGDIDQKLEDAKEALSIVNGGFDTHAGIARKLAHRVISRDDWTEFKDFICPIPLITDEDYTLRRFHKAHDQRWNLDHNFFDHEEQQGKGIAMSAWSAYNAYSATIDHRKYKGRGSRQRAETRFTATQNGIGNDFKQHAWKYWADRVTV